MSEMDETTRAVLTDIIEAVAGAKGVNKGVLLNAWKTIYAGTPTRSYPNKPLLPEQLVELDRKRRAIVGPKV